MPSLWLYCFITVILVAFKLSIFISVTSRHISRTLKISPHVEILVHRGYPKTVINRHEDEANDGIGQKHPVKRLPHGASPVVELGRVPQERPDAEGAASDGQHHGAHGNAGSSGEYVVGLGLGLFAGSEFTPERYDEGEADEGYEDEVVDRERRRLHGASQVVGYVVRCCEHKGFFISVSAGVVSLLFKEWFTVVESCIINFKLFS